MPVYPKERRIRPPGVMKVTQERMSEMYPYDENAPTNQNSTGQPDQPQQTPAQPTGEDGVYHMSGSQIPNAETAYSTPQSTASAASYQTEFTEAEQAQTQQSTQTGYSGYQTPQTGYTQPQDSGYVPYTGTAAPNPPKKKKGGVGKKIGALAIVAAVALVFGVGGSALTNLLWPGSGGSTVVYQSTGAPSSSVQTDGGSTLAEVVSSIENSVVSITTEQISYGSIFGNYVTSGAGSGVIISEDGYIITNQHVIDGATRITVATKDGNTYEATLVGANETADIAVVKINATGLTPAVLGDSDQLSAGDTAIVIGNPLGTLGGTVTYGIISATDRELVVNGSSKDLIQTDASISPGNSGGGLFNGNGELVGIVEAKSSYSEAEGLGFAIPINHAITIAQNLIENEGASVEQAKLGITALTVENDAMAQQYGLNDGAGVYVYQVETGSAADSAGLQVGDKINTIDGTEITSSTQVSEIISSHQPGDQITINVSRGGISGDIQVTLGSDSSSTTSSSNNYNPYSNYFGNYGGLLG